MDGNSFFYTNAMEIRNSFKHSDMEISRSGWFTCSCCPTNVTRLIPSIPGYVYASRKGELFVNLFVSGTATVKVDEKPVEVIQENDYPWKGQLRFTVSPQKAQQFSMRVRVPGWARNEAIPSDLYAFESSSDKKVTIAVNGKPVPVSISNGYATLTRTWKKGDVVSVDLPMEIRRVVANNKVPDDRSKVALQRGPLIYCAEWKDNSGKVSDMIIPSEATFTTEFVSELLNGVQVIRGEVPAVEVKGPTKVETSAKSFTAIPYYAWAHRGPGEMMIWFPTQVVDLTLIATE